MGTVGRVVFSWRTRTDPGPQSLHCTTDTASGWGSCCSWPGSILEIENSRAAPLVRSLTGLFPPSLHARRASLPTALVTMRFVDNTAHCQRLCARDCYRSSGWQSLSRLRMAQCQCLARTRSERPFNHVGGRVSIRRDGRDFVVAFQPENIIVFRHNEATALRRMCYKLRWEVVSDTVTDPNDPASW